MKTIVPLNNLKLQYKTLKEEIDRAVLSVLERQDCILGEEVHLLEKEIARFINTSYAVGVSSGTDALIAALMGLNIGWGDEVITTTYTFFATATAILRVGAKPVLVDIEPDSFNIDPDKIEGSITAKTKAVIPVHLYGQSANMDPILDIAQKHGLSVIEDAAQAIGATYKGKRLGSLGDVGCFSFFPAKNLGCAGDGGIITMSDKSLYDTIMAIRVHGSTKKYYYNMIGGNFRLDTIQAAVLLVKMKHLQEWSEKRRLAAERYRSLFEEKGLSHVVKTPEEVYPGSVYNQFALRVENRDALADYLEKQGIATAIYYPVPVHLQKACVNVQYRAGDFPVSEELARKTLAIPIFPEIREEQQEYVVDKIDSFYALY